jgi:hypothetical protein
MMGDSFEIAENEKNLQYYSYVREAMEQKEMSYWMGNPSVEIISGVISLKPGLDMDTSTSLDSYEAYLQEYRRMALGSPMKRVRTLVMLGIPNSKSPIEACEKLAPYFEWIVEMRVVKANCFRYYALLVLVRDEVLTDKLLREVMGEEYNGVEIERILLREMSEVSYTRTEGVRA